MILIDPHKTKPKQTNKQTEKQNNKITEQKQNHRIDPQGNQKPPTLDTAAPTRIKKR